MRKHPSSWLSLAEAMGVFVLILLYIWRLRFRFPGSWMAIFALILASHAWRKEGPAELGFRGTNFGNSFAKYFPFVLIACAALFGIGSLFGSIREVPLSGALLSFIFYCLWGLFQQYLLNGYFLNRFVEFSRAPERAAILAAIFFCGAHMPNWFLMLITLAGGYCSARVYLRYRNLYFLGLAHGAIGFLIYLAVPDSVSHHLYVGPKWFVK